MARRYEKLLNSWTDWQPVDYDFADLTQQAVRLSGLIPSTRYEVRVHQYAGQPGMIGHIISVETGEGNALLDALFKSFSPLID